MYSSSARVAIDQSLSNAQRYATVVTFASSEQVTLIRVIMFLLDRFSWTTISLICEDPNLKVPDGGVYYFTACRGFRTVLGGQKHKYNLHVHYFDPKIKEGDLDAYSSVLRNAATQSRDERRASWNDRGRLYLYCPTFAYTPYGKHANKKWVASDSAFQSLMLVYNPSPNWAALHEVLQSIRNVSEVRYNRSLTNIEMLNDITVSAFEVMTILLGIIRDLSPLEMDVQNGMTFRQLFLNRTFNPLSRPVYIGPKGMRICDIHISKFNITSGLMEVSEEYLSTAGNSIRTHALSTVWRGRDGPPVNRPFCGYTGELCLGGL
ncbi:hypothetical protein BV898_19880, partial [Hypsibius exemplaris]